MSQQSSADSLDPFKLLPASLFFHVFVSTVGHKGSVKDGPERPQTNYSPSHAQFLSHQNDLVLQKDVLIVGKANISSKREIFFFMWGWGGILDIDKLHYSRRDVFKKKIFKYFLPNSHGGEVSSSANSLQGQICQTSYLHAGQSNLALRG